MFLCRYYLMAHGELYEPAPKLHSGKGRMAPFREISMSSRPFARSIAACAFFLISAFTAGGQDVFNSGANPASNCYSAEVAAQARYDADQKDETQQDHQIQDEYQRGIEGCQNSGCQVRVGR